MTEYKKLVDKYIFDNIHYTTNRKKAWDKVAREPGSGWGTFYHSRLINVYKHLIPEKCSVFEIGCAEGDLLASLNADDGLGIETIGHGVFLRLMYSY